MVGLVIVSHSAALADGVVALAREMDPAGAVAIAAAGGVEVDGTIGLGTDAERVRCAIASVLSHDGVLVLMDLGSALMSAELAVEMLGLGGGSGRVRLADAPLVEGAVAAVATAAGGASLDEVAAAARGALAMKSAQLGAQPPQPAGEPPQPAGQPPQPARDANRPAHEVSVAGALTAQLPVTVAGGLHARPAARLVAALRGLDADVRVAGGSDGPFADARSLTGVLALGARRGDTLTLQASGPDAEAALAALQALGADAFGEGHGRDAAAGAATPEAATSPAPQAVGQQSPPAQRSRPAPGTVLTGIPSAGGIVIGPARHLAAAGGALPDPPDHAAENPERERARLDEALAAAAAAVQRDRATIAAHAPEDEAAIFDAHLALLADAALLAPTRAAIDAGATAERAFHDAAAAVAQRFSGMHRALLRQRSADVTDVGRRVLAALTGEQAATAPTQAGIVIVDELTPAEAAALDSELTTGVAAAGGAPTAHGPILARGLGLPTVLGLGPGVHAVAEGQTLLLDGAAGTVTVDPDPDLARSAGERAETLERWHAHARAHATEPGATRDRRRIAILANLESADDAAEAVALGAEGVGLLRTEFLYLQRETLPGEDEQARALRRIAQALDGRPLVVRTLDAGGDKPMRALPLGVQANPFLGVRGIRVAREHPEVLDAQLRAILRVAADHPLRVMLPMVSIAEEVVAVRAALHRAREATGVDAALPLGIMVEVPAAALTAERLAAHVDFFSIGTNDLTQYTMAAERGNGRVASLLDGFQPAVFRLVAETVHAAAGHHVPVAVCGELAGDPGAAIILAGLGVDELSMSPRRIAEVKAALRPLDHRDALAAAHLALDAADAAEVHGVGANLVEETIALYGTDVA